MLEKNIVKAIMKACRERGAFVTKLHGGPYQQAGLPDLMVIIRGHVIFFEVKTPRGKLTKLQAAMHNSMRDAGGHVYVVRSAAEAMQITSTIMVMERITIWPEGWII